MAKALFHRHQRVYVKTVGTWAVVEKVIPQWAKGIDEPLRIFYEVGLGREFAADELSAEHAVETSFDAGPDWRVIRAGNKWQVAQNAGRHPFPGTYPVVVTRDTDWGGWRVPGAEYDLNPINIEAQARLIAGSPKLFGIAVKLLELVRDHADGLPDEMLVLARDAARVVKSIEGDAEPS